MFDRIMGRYMLDRGRLTEVQLALAYQVQDTRRAKLGVIAVTEKLMTVAQAEEINALQATMDKRFGDLAVERGYLNDIQVGYLLSLQGNEFLTFTSTLIERGFMTLEEVDSFLNDFQVEKGLSNDDMVTLKNGEISAMVPIFAETTDPEYLSLFKYGVKNIYRLVDVHVAIDNAYVAHNIKGECLGYQSITGDVSATVAIVGKNKDMQLLAKSYTKEEFIETEEDALDAMCELINCINGLYATDKSKQGKKIELAPPIFKTKFAEISGEELHVMPIYSSNAEALLVIALGSAVSVK